MTAMIEADIVVSSTGSPTTVLHKDEIAGILAARSNRPLVLVDIAVPRDIAPDVEELDNVYLYNIDHLEAIVRENSRMREQELSKCNEIIARRAAALMMKLNPPARHPAGRRRGTGAGLGPVRGIDLNEIKITKTNIYADKS